MKKTSTLLLSTLAISFFLPSIALAAWWNPFTWNILKFFPWFNKPVKTEVANIARTTNNQIATTTILATTTRTVGYIKNVYQKDGKYYLDIDYIELTKNWVPDGDSDMPYTDIDPIIRTFEISEDVFISKLSFVKSTNGLFEWNAKNATTSVEDFNNVVGQGDYPHPFFIRITNGIIVNITEWFFS